MVESEIADRIAARRAELDEREDHLVKQLDQVRSERDELAVAERDWQRMAEQLAAETAAAAPVAAQVAGHAVLLVPHRGPGVGKDALPPEHQQILAIVRGALAGPTRARRPLRLPQWRDREAARDRKPTREPPCPVFTRLLRHHHVPVL
ncbi:hypothetical protein ACWGK1_20325 [Streptomyces wedmorensis]